MISTGKEREPEAVQAWGNKVENLRRLARELPDLLDRIEAGRKTILAIAEGQARLS